MAGVTGVWVAKLVVVVVAMVATIGAAPAAAGDPPVPYSTPAAA